MVLSGNWLYCFCVAVNVHMPKDRITQVHQSYGFVEFMSEEDADYAIKIMNMIKLYGKPIRVNKVSFSAIPCLLFLCLCFMTPEVAAFYSFNLHSYNLYSTGCVQHEELGRGSQCLHRESWPWNRWKTPLWYIQCIWCDPANAQGNTITPSCYLEMTLTLAH